MTDVDKAEEFLLKQGYDELRRMFFGDKKPIDYVIDYLTSIGTIEHENIVTLYFSSVGAHIVNLINRSCHDYCPFANQEKMCHRRGLRSTTRHFWVRTGQVVDTRVNVMMISPPGMGKTYFMKLFLDEQSGFLKGVFDHEIMSVFTTAGFEGTKDIVDHKTVKVYGTAKDLCAGILGFDEFERVMKQTKTSYSFDVIDSFLTILDSGKVDKKLGVVHLEYPTLMTLWAAVRPNITIDMTSGFARRMNFYVFIPSKEVEERLTEQYLGGYTKKPNRAVVDHVRTYLKKLWRTTGLTPIYDRETVPLALSPEYETFRKGLKHTLHTDFGLYDSVAIGYTFINSFNGKGIYVELDDRLKQLLIKLSNDRVLLGEDYRLHWKILTDIIGSRTVSMNEVVREMNTRHYMSYQQAINTVEFAISEGVVDYFYSRRSTGSSYKVLFLRKYFPTVDVAKADWSIRQKAISVKSLNTK